MRPTTSRARSPNETRMKGEWARMTEQSSEPVVGIVMGSDSDWPVMREAAAALGEFGIPYEADVVSAHRMGGGE